MRVGHGFDAHRLVEGQMLVLGGVEIPYHQRLQGHSDADVLIHAICDALLGASGLGDIGNLFPDTDDRNRNRNSREFLTEVHRLLQSHAIGVVNVDATLIAQAPKLGPFIGTMRSNLSADLELDQSFVNVKATTTEGLGFTGRAEGIAAHAVVLVEQSIA
ncbi:MAG: 2-C-methyl-D-erythritol 2,4-cyclodiphosphate synthase [Pseudomonadota bacterium]|nr:2-C-methyl-D-erythritol 2,4-cyclodiphosphate synthase [Pseudomonadota bacterium]MEC8872126.1 2-C-methyl-D-erythritol 2,4-cyclodiphosphate synthase [Pseudomonadota bacterium]MEC8961569.1 2-C-methyl-D-erythritol 2,4-cyclodiphosphate synthase [Pseudomonadota bacterium]MEE3293006.1 2-C-methyl-D-erythritol 2,4-cyclodiphosphate synthase [Pseudomonadota bacterium]